MNTFIKPFLFTILILSTLAAIDYSESSTGIHIPEFEGGSTEFEFADINGDGHVDIISVGDHGSPFINTDQHGIMVWLGDGDGGFSLIQSGNFGYGGVAAGDLNGDGLMDIGYGIHHDYSSNDFGDQLLEVALGDGTGTGWTPWDNGLATNGEDWGMFGTDFADVDNDGDLDLVSISFGCCAGIHVYLNQGDGSWLQSWGFYGGNSNNSVQFGDINNDGNVDIAASHQDGTVYFGDGSGGFQLMDLNLPYNSYHGTSLGDVDNDGQLDLAFISSPWSGGVSIWTWNDSETSWEDISGSLPATGGYEMTQLADMNSDGLTDLLAFGNGLVSLWLGNGGDQWELAFQAETPPDGNCEAFRAGGDIDHNGYPDFVLLSDEGGWPSEQNRMHLFNETSVAGTLSITPVYPNGYEKFQPGSVMTIKWLSAIPGDQGTTVDLAYSFSGPAGPWHLIAQGLPNNSSYQWNTPITYSDQYYIEYTVHGDEQSFSSITALPFAVLGEGILGDVNLDQTIDVLDIVTMVNLIINQQWTEYQLAAGDLNQDGELNILDVIQVLNLILAG